MRLVMSVAQDRKLRTGTIVELPIPRAGWATAFRQESSYMEGAAYTSMQIMRNGFWEAFPTSNTSQYNFWERLPARYVRKNMVGGIEPTYIIDVANYQRWP
jgi:hypothetical protein